jgi:hypothetical protein
MRLPGSSSSSRRWKRRSAASRKSTFPARRGLRRSTPAELALNVNLSDLHYGAALDGREVPLAYGHTEEARRTAAVALWIAHHRTLKDRQQMKLVLNIIGDIIQNQLHDPRDGDPLTEQFAASVHLLTQLIVFVSASGYQEVLVNFTPGNHGRNTARHQDRATNQKWDAIETMIYYAISKAVAHLPNVKVNLPYTPFVTYKVFEHNIFATHGDTVIKPGLPESDHQRRRCPQAGQRDQREAYPG